MPIADVKVFISYAREDAESANQIYRVLNRPGINPWLDTKSILPGQKWSAAIREAIRESHFVIAILSSSSVTKRGYVQKEIREALDVVDQLPESQIFLIPVRLEICSPGHQRLEEIHWVDLFPSWEKGLDKILNTIGVPPQIELGYIDKLDAHVTNLEFFEGGYKTPKKRTYQYGFVSSEVRYINWEISLAFSHRTTTDSFTIDADWYRADGSIFIRQARKSFIDKKWHTSRHWHGWGNRTRGKFWKPGDYRVVISVDGAKIASGWFRVFE